MAARGAWLFVAALSLPAAASEVAVNGYVGYAGVNNNLDVECSARACMGVVDDTAFYGLSLGFQEGRIGGQVILSQDVNQDPRIALAQLSLTGSWNDYIFTGRLGRIIVPLGLYGTHRITPNTRPGLVLPQSLLLNSFYDLLTLSEDGLGAEVRNENGFALKAALYKPSDEVIEQISIVPAPSPLPPASQGLLNSLLQLLLGSSPPPSNPVTPPTVVVQRDTRNDRGYYLGAGFEQENWRTDIGWTRLQFGEIDLDAYNAGLEYTWRAFQPSVEVLRLETENGKPLDGVSLNLVYSGENWQLFGSAVRLEIDGRKANEDVLGGAYYLGAWSVRLAHHRFRGTALNTSVSGDDAQSTVLGVAYSFSFNH